MLNRFDLKVVDLANGTGLFVQRISQFKNGFNIRIDTLQKLLQAMPLESARYMLLLVAEGDINSPPEQEGSR